MSSNSKSRIYKFDNVKFVAILFVVIGHFVEGFTDKSDMFKSLFIFIYAFHMPLFIFISGLFQKRFSDQNRLKINKIAYYIILGFILKLLCASAQTLSGKAFKFDFFGGSTIDWFMFVMAMFMATAFALRNIKPYIVLPLSVIVGCVCGYFNFIGDSFYLSRYLVYLPIYMLGYYLTPDVVISFTSKIYVKCVAYVSLLVYFVICFRNVNVIYKLRRLFTGKNPFSTVPIDGCGAQHRLMCYAISLVLCTAVICIVPNIKIPMISDMGSNTLGVYFWHNIILHMLRATPVFALMLSTGDPMYKVLILTSAVVLCLVLSLGVFSYPLNLLSKQINKLNKKWCCILIALPFAIGVLVMCKDLWHQTKYLFSGVKYYIGL